MTTPIPADRQPEDDNKIGGLTPAQIHELLHPLDPTRVHIKEPDGLRYLKQEDVRRRLTQIFGPTGWGEENLSLRCISSNKDERSGLTVIIYEARVRLHIRDGHGGSLTFFDGVGIFDGTQRPVKRGVLETVVQAHHNVANAACSAAFVRAAASLGDQFGLSLYSDNPGQPYVGHTLALPSTIPTSHIPAQATAEAEVHADSCHTENTEGEDKPDDDEYQYDGPQDPHHPQGT